MASDLRDVPWERDGVEVRAFIETPRGSRFKYAYDPDAGTLRVLYMLARGLSWPYDFGFIPQTLQADGDPVDVLVMNEEPTLPLSVSHVRLLGGFEMAKNGVRNDRLLACPKQMKGIVLLTDQFTSIEDIAEKELHQIEQFLREYSEEQGNRIELPRRYGSDQALALLTQWHEDWAKNRVTPSA